MASYMDAWNCWELVAEDFSSDLTARVALKSHLREQWNFA